MLVIRLERGVTFTLDRSIGNAGKYGIWEFHRGESSFMSPPDYTPWRHAAILPADPSNGQSVRLAVCMPGMPEAEWKHMGEGTANYESER